MPYDVIVSGHLCADLIPEMPGTSLSALAAPGKLFEVGSLTIATGGVVSNTGSALHRLGIEVGMMTIIGDDLLGNIILTRLKERDSRFGNLIRVCKNQSSSYSIIFSPENADRVIFHYPGNNALFDITDIDFEVVRDTKIFHFGYPPVLPHLYANEGETLLAAYRRIHEMGVLTSLDMCHPDAGGPSGQVNWRRILQRVLPYVDIFLPSIEEIVFMVRRADYDRWQGDVLHHLTHNYMRDLAGELLSMGVTMTGFKLGEYGFYLKTAGESAAFTRFAALPFKTAEWQNLDLWHPAFAVKVVGTIGAGDCAYGGFLAALLRGLKPQVALRFACAVGASNVEAADATSGVRSWGDTLARIEEGWVVSTDQLPD